MKAQDLETLLRRARVRIQYASEGGALNAELAEQLETAANELEAQRENALKRSRSSRAIAAARWAEIETHLDNILQAIEQCEKRSPPANEDQDDAAYWRHEAKAVREARAFVPDGIQAEVHGPELERRNLLMACLTKEDATFQNWVREQFAIIDRLQELTDAQGCEIDDLEVELADLKNDKVDEVPHARAMKESLWAAQQHVALALAAIDNDQGPVNQRRPTGEPGMNAVEHVKWVHSQLVEVRNTIEELARQTMEPGCILAIKTANAAVREAVVLLHMFDTSKPLPARLAVIGEAMGSRDGED